MTAAPAGAVPAVPGAVPAVPVAVPVVRARSRRSRSRSRRSRRVLVARTVVPGGQRPSVGPKAPMGRQAPNRSAKPADAPKPETEEPDAPKTEQS